jgi:hypothetical protein
LTGTTASTIPLQERKRNYSEWKKMHKMGTGMIDVKKNDGNTLQADRLDHRGFHLPHHILIKERTSKKQGKHFERDSCHIDSQLEK